MKIGAYFYPLTTKCPIRTARSRSIGFMPVDETELVHDATKLYPEHDQPKIYTLGNKNITTWDDSDQSAIDLQIEMAQKYGIDFFIFDAYIGKKSGKFIHEVFQPLTNFKNHKYNKNKKMEYAIMLCMNSPRVVFPVPVTKEYIEPNRNYDIDPIAARLIVDKCVNEYWIDDNYLHIKGRPYISFFMPDFSKNENLKKEVKDFFYEFSNYANKKYHIDPYMVGVLKSIRHLDAYLESGIKKFTGYQQLVEFDLSAPPLQDYMEMLRLRKKEWYKIAERNATMIPPVVVGWDSSPRGERNRTLQEVTSCYPYTPILINGSPQTFKTMFRYAHNFIKKEVSEDEQYMVICAWNEVSQGNALLPRLIGDKLDFSYLNALKSLIEELKI